MELKPTNSKLFGALILSKAHGLTTKPYVMGWFVQKGENAYQALNTKCPECECIIVDGTNCSKCQTPINDFISLTE